MRCHATATTALVLVGCFALACGPRESALVVQVSGWPDGAARLRVMSSFAGKSGKTVFVDPNTEEFSIAIPTGQAGQAAVEGIVQDSTGCDIAGNVERIEFGGNSGPEVEHIVLTLTRYIQKSCAKVCSPGGWCWENPTPAGAVNLSKIWGSSPVDVWAVGSGGVTVHWDGSVWQSVASNTTTDLISLFGSGPNDVWAISATSTIHWDGLRWSEQMLNTANAMLLGGGGGFGEAWAVGFYPADNTGFSGYWAGGPWVSIPKAPTDLREVLAIDNNTIYAASRGGVLRWNGTKRTWEPEVGALPLDLTSISGALGNVWAGTVTGDLLHWDGVMWSKASTMPNLGPIRAVSVGPTDVFLLTEMDGSIYRRNGMSQVQVIDGRTARINSMWGVPGNYWAVGERGTIYRSDGISWSPQSQDASAGNQILGLWGSDPFDIWAVGTSGTILHWDGNRWTKINSGTTESLGAIWGSGPNDIWAAGVKNNMLHWDGQAWLPKVTPPQPGMLHIWGTGSHEVWASGGAGNILHWDGTDWAAETSGTTQNLGGLWGSGSADVWAVGDHGAIRHRTTSTTWDSFDVDPANVLNSVWGSDAKNVWAVGRGGTILKWDGNKWTTQTSKTSQDLASVWGSAANPTSVWAAGNGGTVLKWDGSQWTIQPVGTANTLTSVWGSDASNIWVAGSGGTLLHYQPN